LKEGVASLLHLMKKGRNGFPFRLDFVSLLSTFDPRLSTMA